MKGNLLGLALIIALLGSYYWTYQHGKSVVQAEWDIASSKQEKAMKSLQDKYDQLSLDHKSKSDSYTESLKEQKDDYENRIADLQHDTDRRLRLSETRASVYQRQAEGGEVERRDLARHAAELDRALEEGISVVGELKELVGLRDQQLITLGSQIKADRQLLEEIDRHE